jgi:hypothetical protein
MFMKKLLVAAALTMCATGAYASNFRGADQVYIPTAGRIINTGGNSFVSDVQLANLTGDTVVISVIYQPLNDATNPSQPSTIGQEFKDVIVLRPFERKEYKDFFLSGLNQQGGFGLLIFNGCKQGENCGPTGTDDEANSEHYRAISAESRIYSYRSPGPQAGTVGQLFSGYPWYNFVSMLQAGAQLDEVFITGLRQNASFRSNIGIINASQYSSTTIAATLYRGRVHADDKLAEVLVDLTPLQNIQRSLPALFPGVNFGTGEDLFVVLEQRSATPNPSGVPSTCDNGCPAFVAYGSILDNITNDATTLETQYMKELTLEQIIVLYPTSVGKQPHRRAVRK